MESSSFQEVLGNTAENSSPKAQFYECKIKISNSGSKWLSDCQLRLVRIEYRGLNEKKQTYKEIKLNNPKTIYFSDPNDTTFDLREGECLTKVLAKIYPDNESITPDFSKKSEKRFSVVGCSNLINGAKSKSGNWRVEYHILTPEKIISKFQITYYWDGQWFSRNTEMVNHSSIDFKNIKI